MDCATFQAQLTATLTDRGDASRRDALVEHAQGCTTCRRLLQDSDEAQRALENLFGANKTDPRRVQALGESLYAERFGSALEIKPRTARPGVAATGVAAQLPTPLVLGAAAGLIVGYVIWGASGGPQNMMMQLWLEQMYTGGRLGGGGPFLPGMMRTAGSAVRDLFGICFVIWLCRSRLWQLIFPVDLPRGVYMARMLAMPLVAAGIIRVGGEILLGPASTIMRSTGWDIASNLPLFGLVWLFMDAVWRYGFWLLIFLLLFTVIDNLTLQFLQPKPPANRGG